MLIPFYTKHKQIGIAKWLGAQAWGHTKQGFVEVFEKTKPTEK